MTTYAEVILICLADATGALMEMSVETMMATRTVDRLFLTSLLASIMTNLK